MRTIEDKAEELPGAGYNDIIHGGGNFMAYTRGNQKEVKIIHIYNHSFKKTVKVPVNVMHFQLNSSGTELIALGSDTPLTEAYKDVRLMIWETSNWNLIKDVKSQFDHVWIIVHSICIIETKQGLELIWPILDRINFWNLETNKERVALKSVSILMTFSNFALNLNTLQLKVCNSHVGFLTGGYTLSRICLRISAFQSVNVVLYFFCSFVSSAMSNQPSNFLLWVRSSSSWAPLYLNSVKPPNQAHDVSAQ